MNTWPDTMATAATKVEASEPGNNHRQDSDERPRADVLGALAHHPVGGFVFYVFLLVREVDARSEGDYVTWVSPAGDMELTILSIAYSDDT